MGRSLVERADRRKHKEDERPYEPRGASRELMRDKTREILLAGPAGTGKSRACLEKLNLVAMQQPIRGAIVRKVRKTLSQAALVTFEEKVLPKPSSVRFWTEDQEYRYPSGAVVAVCGLDDPEKIKSTEFDMIYVQEATELEQLDWELLVSRLRNGVLSYQQLIGDCNPTYPEHWLKARCDGGACRLYESLHQDNPMLWDSSKEDWTDFGRGYMDTLDSLTGYQYRRLRLGEWCAAEGMYFTEWSPRLHVVPARDIPPEWPKWIAVDYGFAAPFCCLWFAREPESRMIYVYREVYAAGLRDEQQAELIVQRTADEVLVKRVLDPSMFNLRTEQQRPSIAQVYASCGLWPLEPGMNNRKQGWAIVRRALAHTAELPPRVRIFDGRCPNLVRTIPSLVMDPLDPEDVADKVHSAKVEDHAPDAFRYGLAAEAQPIPPGEVREVRWG
jgi:PBSX family phage terminase large subunit